MKNFLKNAWDVIFNIFCICFAAIIFVAIGLLIYSISPVAFQIVLLFVLIAMFVFLLWILL